MKIYEGQNVRNVALVGHGDTGKTQLVSAVLYTAGMVNRLGKVDDGTSVTDYDEEEIQRKFSISASLAYAGLLGFGLTTRINNLCFYLILLYGVFGVASMAALIGTLTFSVTRAGVLLLAARTVGGEYHDDPEHALSRLTRWRSGTADLEVVLLVA